MPPRSRLTPERRRPPATENLTLPLGICTSVFGHRHALSAGKLRQLARMPIDCIEIAALQEPHLNCFDEERVEELARQAEGLHLHVWSFHAPFLGLAMDDADTRRENVRKLIQASKVAKRFGAGVVVVHPGRDVPTVNLRRELGWMRDGLARAAEKLPAGLKLAVETMGPKSLAGPLDDMLYVVDALRGAPVGVCLDTGHVNTGCKPADYARHLAGRILSVHLHDNFGDKDAHSLPGEGNIDWPLTLRAIRRAGYDGAWMCEAAPAGLPVRAFLHEFARRMKKHCAG